MELAEKINNIFPHEQQISTPFRLDTAVCKRQVPAWHVARPSGSRGTRFFDRFGITLTKIPRSIGNGSLVLRSWRFKDLPVLYTLFTPEVFGKACGIARRPFHFFFSFCTWIFTTFQIIYVIQVGESCERRIIGFVGLYNLEIGGSLQSSLAIFRPEDRRCGYGQQAFTLLLRALQSNRVVKTVSVEVLKANVASLRFWQKLGFAVRGQKAERFVLEKSVEERSGI